MMQITNGKSEFCKNNDESQRKNWTNPNPTMEIIFEN